MSRACHGNIGLSSRLGGVRRRLRRSRRRRAGAVNLEQDDFWTNRAAGPSSDRSHRLFHLRGKGIQAAPYNPAAPDLTPRFRRPVLACSDLINACSAPVSDLLSRLFRARSGPQPAGCKTSNAMTLQGFPERMATAARKNALLAGARIVPPYLP